MNPITDGWEKEKPAKVKQAEKPAPVETPKPTKADNWKRTNVKTREEWLDHLKTLKE